MRECKCDEYSAHLADLRNKFGGISSYFQLKEKVDAGNEELRPLMEEAEKRVMGSQFRQFFNLLREDVRK